MDRRRIKEEKGIKEIEYENRIFNCQKFQENFLEWQEKKHVRAVRYLYRDHNVLYAKAMILQQDGREG